MTDVMEQVPAEMRTALGVIERIGGHELVARLAVLFETSVRQRTAAFVNCSAAGDRPQVARVAHATKGSAAQFGAEPLRLAAAALEQEALELKPRELAARIAGINAEAERTIVLLGTYIRERSS